MEKTGEAVAESENWGDFVNGGKKAISDMEALVIEKEKLQELIKGAPEHVLIDDFIDQMIIYAKLEKALDQLERGQFMTSEQLDEEIKKWGKR